MIDTLLEQRSSQVITRGMPRTLLSKRNRTTHIYGMKGCFKCSDTRTRNKLDEKVEQPVRPLFCAALYRAGKKSGT